MRARPTPAGEAAARRPDHPGADHLDPGRYHFGTGPASDHSGSGPASDHPGAGPVSDHPSPAPGHSDSDHLGPGPSPSHLGPAPDYLSPAPDYLGPTWVATSFFLADDDGGTPRGRPDVAVLVHERDAAQLAGRSKVAALYLPGFLDTFFHVEQAAAFRSLGIPLAGLDMRRCGRSVRSHTSRDDLRDIYVREEEIGIALDALRGLGAQRIVLIGHSTGGLQAALWAADHPGSVDALVLNSPWLDHNGSWIERVPTTKLVDRLGARFPAMPIGLLSARYPRSLHADYGGEFAFDARHKPLRTEIVRAGFFRSVRRAQARVAAGKVRVGVPLLIAHSDASGRAKFPSPADLASRDCVLGVEDMKRLGPLLSDDAEFLEIPSGRHDLALSRRQARDAYTRGVTDWIRRTLDL